MSKLPGINRTEKRYNLAKQITFRLLSIILFLFAIITIRNFLYPIAFGFLLAYLIYPVANWLEKRGVPRILANLITIIGVLAVLASLFLIAYQRITPFTGDLPNLVEEGIANFSQMLGNASEYFGFNPENTQRFIKRQASNLIESGSQYLQALFGATTNTIVAIGLMPVYIFMFLYYRTKFMYFLLKLFGRQNRKEVVGILREISTVMVRYMVGVITVVFVLCIINSLGIYIIGLKYAIPLGVTAAFFNFIPYFGTLLGGLVPFMFALLVEGDIVLTFRVVILFVIIQFLENNILTPNIVGGNVKINPFFIITGLVAASMVWGIPGMLLITPFLAILRIIFSHIEYMKPYAFLLGEEGTSRHTLNISNIKNFWKKRIRSKF
ncbi:MAG: AI-2E family transporter [Bacteroidales bacterium]|nr:AI-2E family transporter [Bacteroidales bacterium]